MHQLKKQATTTSRHNYNNKCFVIVLMMSIWRIRLTTCMCPPYHTILYMVCLTSTSKAYFMEFLLFACCQNMDERWIGDGKNDIKTWSGNILLVIHCNFLISFVQAKLPQMYFVSMQNFVGDIPNRAII